MENTMKMYIPQMKLLNYSEYLEGMHIKLFED